MKAPNSNPTPGVSVEFIQGDLLDTLKALTHNERSSTYAVNPANGAKIGGSLEGAMLKADPLAKKQLQERYQHAPDPIAQGDLDSTASTLAQGMLHAVGINFNRIQKGGMTEESAKDIFKQLYIKMVESATGRSKELHQHHQPITIKMPIISGGDFRGKVTQDQLIKIQTQALQEALEKSKDHTPPVKLQVYHLAKDGFGSAIEKYWDKEKGCRQLAAENVTDTQLPQGLVNRIINAIITFCDFIKSLKPNLSMTTLKEKESHEASLTTPLKSPQTPTANRSGEKSQSFNLS